MVTDSVKHIMGKAGKDLKRYYTMTSHVETQRSYEPGYELVAWNISP